MLFHNEELSGPIGSLSKRRDDSISHVFRGRYLQAKQEHSAACRQSPSKRQFAEVFVERDDQPLIVLRPLQNHIVRRPRHVGARPQNVMADIPQASHCQQGKVLVLQGI